MMVSSRMVKPHMVKKWADPGHRPLQELALAGHFGQLGLGPGHDAARVRSGAGAPDRIRRDSQWKRRPAMARAMTVTAMPMAILTGNGPPQDSELRGTAVLPDEGRG